jgi:TRAP-type C4-dicarboxylate transport system permease small subunit
MRSTENEYATAGYLAIAAAVLILPSFVLGIATEVAKHRAPEIDPPSVIPYFAVSICYTIAALYVVIQLQDAAQQTPRLPRHRRARSPPSCRGRSR